MLLPAGLAVSLVAGLSARWFVWPRGDDTGRADAVIVLAGGDGERLDRGLELMNDGVAPTLAISNGRDPEWRRAHPLCDGKAPFAVICFRPEPLDTRGEARTVARLAEREGWDRVVVVTSSYHVFRARMVFDRCLPGPVAAVPAHPPDGIPLLRLVAMEWAKLVWLTVIDRGC